MSRDTSQTGAADLRRGIAAIRGWDSAISEALQGFGHALYLGRMISSIILAAGEHNEPLAIAGALDDEGTGYLAVAYENFLVISDVAQISDRAGSYTVKLLGWGSVESIEVTTKHSHIGDSEPREPKDTIALLLTVAGQPLHFMVRDGDSPLVKGAAIHSVLVAIRGNLSAR